MGVFAWYTAVLTQQAVFNTAFHAGTTIAWREYSPGLFSALGLFLPVWARLTRLAMREGLLSPRTVALAVGIAGPIHAAVVADQVFFVRAPS